MQQIYFCPNCGAPIVYSNRFCGNCGVHLQWELQQAQPESLSTGYDCPNPGRQQTSSSQQPYAHAAHAGSSSGQHASSNEAVTPLSAEVSKMLEEFFDKRAKCV
jgi:hypothetical protein